MDLLSRFEYHSKVIPGVVVKFKRFTLPARAAFLQAKASARVAVREIERERQPFDEEYDAVMSKARSEAKLEVDRLMEAEQIDRAAAEKQVLATGALLAPHIAFCVEHPQWVDLKERQEHIERDILGAARLRRMLVSIEGLSTDGTPVTTAEDLIERIPVGADEEPSLTDELMTVAEQIAGLGATERGESPWPGTSPPAEVGPPSNTNAIPAEPEKEPA